MPVIWSAPGERWNDPALAIPCPTCNVEIGRPCEAVSGTVPTHRPRSERAEVFGFRLAGASETPGSATPKPRLPFPRPAEQEAGRVDLGQASPPPPHLRTADLFGGI